MTRLVEPAVTEPFRDGRAAERALFTDTAAHQWSREQWQIRAADLARQIDAVDTPAPESRIHRRNLLFGRYSIATDLAEGRSIT